MNGDIKKRIMWGNIISFSVLFFLLILFLSIVWFVPVFYDKDTGEKLVLSERTKFIWTGVIVSLAIIWVFIQLLWSKYLKSEKGKPVVDFFKDNFWV